MARRLRLFGVLALAGLAFRPAAGAEEWRQLKFDALRSGNVPERSVAAPLGLLAAIPLSDAVFTAPVVSEGKAYVIDGAGVVWAIDT